MRLWARLPIRYRLTIVFGLAMAVVLGGLSVFVYAQTGSNLLATIDADLNSRAGLLVSDARDDGPSQVNVRPALIDNAEVFAQIDNTAGRVLRSTSLIARSRLLAPAQARSLRRARLYNRTVSGIDNVTRVLAVPVATRHRRMVVAVGTSLQDRHDELVQLAVTLAIAGAATLLLISAGAWLALAGALRPVERMRRQATEITASDPSRRLSAPAGRDEIALLGATLNQMLDRIEASVVRERRLVDRASHELRTPLAIQRIGLDLALSGPQTVEELTDALCDISRENAHLTRLTQDLLVLSRARGGVLPIQRAKTSLRELLAEACRRQRGLAAADVQVTCTAADHTALVDPVWFRQAVDNLIENAVRHTPAGGRVDVSAYPEDGMIWLVVQDTGPGFAEDILGQALEPFARAGRGLASGPHSAGLGLAMVAAIAQTHGGRAWAANRPGGGARVTMVVPAGIESPA
jgi:two-component system, OmpR family, sensor kinase